eukprot:TRINITY_DN23949_c0_g1_i1.p1 TRINITY_DN23949_c0_g1~~TRINITY_DN23949_c0_g1_i1.p1  ORF type:complete len:570 (+),score=88.86 TRINITY_DN23949_c0_g1_i1:76-1785(+)
MEVGHVFCDELDKRRLRGLGKPDVLTALGEYMMHEVLVTGTPTSSKFANGDGVDPWPAYVYSILTNPNELEKAKMHAESTLPDSSVSVMFRNVFEPRMVQRVRILVLTVLGLYAPNISELHFSTGYLRLGDEGKAETQISVVDLVSGICALPNVTSLRMADRNLLPNKFYAAILESLGPNLTTLCIETRLGDGELENFCSLIPRFKKLEILHLNVGKSFEKFDKLLDGLIDMPFLSSLFLTGQLFKMDLAAESVVKLQDLAQKETISDLSLNGILCKNSSSIIFNSFIAAKKCMTSYLSVIGLDPDAFESKIDANKHVSNFEVRFFTQKPYSRQVFPLTPGFHNFIIQLKNLCLHDFIFTDESLTAFGHSLQRASNLETLAMKGCTLPMDMSASQFVEILAASEVPHVELIQLLAPDEFYVVLASFAFAVTKFSTLIVRNEYDQGKKFLNAFKEISQRSLSLRRIQDLQIQTYQPRDDPASRVNSWLRHNVHMNRTWSRTLLIHKLLRYKDIEMDILPTILGFCFDNSVSCEKGCSTKIPFVNEVTPLFDPKRAIKSLMNLKNSNCNIQ